jgi:cytochrome c oxidase subunit 2
VSAGALSLSGCNGVQSALAPAGRDAQYLAGLFWWMAGGAVVIWVIVIGLFIYALRRPETHNRRRAAILIIGGGAVIPVIVLGFLLVFGLSALPELAAPAPEGSLTISVSGEQWWWRVRYHAPGDRLIETANEIRLPVGQPVEFRLQSADVIHSFWIPPLGGKVDMIPGRLTRLALEPTRTGVFRGVCAEYCGTSHALMAFDTVILDREDFMAWLEHQSRPARIPEHPLAARGSELFQANGCGACHTIRGTSADGSVGPDLTHVGTRLSIGAGTLENEHNHFLRWIARTNDAKPDVHMPAFGMLPPEDLKALAAYLGGLE